MVAGVAGKKNADWAALKALKKVMELTDRVRHFIEQWLVEQDTTQPDESADNSIACKTAAVLAHLKSVM